MSSGKIQKLGLCVCVCVSPSLKNIISLFLTFEYDIFLEDQERRKK